MLRWLRFSLPGNGRLCASFRICPQTSRNFSRLPSRLVDLPLITAAQEMTRRNKSKKAVKPETIDLSGLSEALPSVSEDSREKQDLRASGLSETSDAKYASRQASVVPQGSEAYEHVDTEEGGVPLNAVASQAGKSGRRARGKKKPKAATSLSAAQIKKSRNTPPQQKKQQKTQEPTQNIQSTGDLSPKPQQMLPFYPNLWGPLITYPSPTFQQPWHQHQFNAQPQPWQYPSFNAQATPFQPAYPYATFTPPLHQPAPSQRSGPTLCVSAIKQQQLPLTYSPAYNATTSAAPQPLGYAQPLLIVLDLNGTLLSRSGYNFKTVTPRPNLHSFLKYCFDNHRVMVWTSAKPENMEHMLSCILTDPSWRPQLLAAWGRDTFGLSHDEYIRKVQVVKDLDQVWSHGGIQGCHPWMTAGWTWNVGNTVLVDDSLKKAVRQPWNALRVPEFEDARIDKESNGELDVLGEVREYLEGLRRWDNVGAYLRREPFRASS